MFTPGGSEEIAAFPFLLFQEGLCLLVERGWERVLSGQLEEERNGRLESSEVHRQGFELICIYCRLTLGGPWHVAPLLDRVGAPALRTEAQSQPFSMHGTVGPKVT